MTVLGGVAAGAARSGPGRRKHPCQVWQACSSIQCAGSCPSSSPVIRLNVFSEARVVLSWVAGREAGHPQQCGAGGWRETLSWLAWADKSPDADERVKNASCSEE